MDTSEAMVWRSEISDETLDSNRRSYVTDVFRRGSKPRAGAIGIGFQPDEEGTLQAVGIGAARAPTGIANGKVRTRFDFWMPLIPPVDLSAVNEQISKQDPEVPYITVPETLAALPYRGKSGRALVTALATLRPQIADWIRETSDEAPVPAELRQVRDEARDAITLAADVAGVELPPDTFRHVDRPPDGDSLLELVVNSAYVADLEEDLIPEELRRFDDDTEVRRVSASASVFTDTKTGHQLAVFNVNKKPFEIELGVDLVYWDKTNDAFTLIQYKRLEKVATTSGGFTNEWVYRRENELRKQLNLMPTITIGAGNSRDWRIVQSPFWFKFVRGDAGRADDKLLLSGMYVPAELLQIAIEDDSLRTGPNRGFRLSYDNIKYVTKQTFVELLKRGLIGTDSAHSKDLHPAIRDLSKTGRQTLIAVKEKWNNRTTEADPPNLAHEPF